MALKFKWTVAPSTDCEPGSSRMICHTSHSLMQRYDFQEKSDKEKRYREDFENSLRLCQGVAYAEQSFYSVRITKAELFTWEEV